MAPQPRPPIALPLALAFEGSTITMGRAFFTLCKTSVPLCLFDGKRWVVGQKLGKRFEKGWALMQKTSPDDEQEEITAGGNGGRARVATISAFSYLGLILR